MGKICTDTLYSRSILFRHCNWENSGWPLHASYMAHRCFYWRLMFHFRGSCFDLVDFNCTVSIVTVWLFVGFDLLQSLMMLYVIGDSFQLLDVCSLGNEFCTIGRWYISCVMIIGSVASNFPFFFDCENSSCTLSWTFRERYLKKKVFLSEFRQKMGKKLDFFSKRFYFLPIFESYCPTQ